MDQQFKVHIQGLRELPFKDRKIKQIAFFFVSKKDDGVANGCKYHFRG
jgi:hypothetical protein